MTKKSDSNLGKLITKSSNGSDAVTLIILLGIFILFSSFLLIKGEFLILLLIQIPVAILLIRIPTKVIFYENKLCCRYVFVNKYSDYSEFNKYAVVWTSSFSNDAILIKGKKKIGIPFKDDKHKEEIIALLKAKGLKRFKTEQEV